MLTDWFRKNRGYAISASVVAGGIMLAAGVFGFANFKSTETAVASQSPQWTQGVGAGVAAPACGSAAAFITCSGTASKITIAWSNISTNHGVCAWTNVSIAGGPTWNNQPCIGSVTWDGAANNTQYSYRIGYWDDRPFGCYAGTTCFDDGTGNQICSCNSPEEDPPPREILSSDDSTFSPPGEYKDPITTPNCDPLIVSCAVSPTSATVGGPVTWTASVGGFASTQTFTSNGTWVKPAGVRHVWVEVIGGGGGGSGGYENCGAGGGGGSGGGGGGFAGGLLDVSGISSVPVTVGSMGNGAATPCNPGLNGETSTFGSYMSASGGGGGQFAGTTGGSAGLGSGGTFNNKGTDGFAGVVYGSGGNGGFSGQGSAGGGGGAGVTTCPVNAAPGGTPSGNGGGGGGGGSVDPNLNCQMFGYDPKAAGGGNGAPGIVIVREYKGSGGTGSYSYSWSGSEGLSCPGQPSAACQTVEKTYSTPSPPDKTGSVTVTSGVQTVGPVACTNAVTVSAAETLSTNLSVSKNNFTWSNSGLTGLAPLNNVGLRAVVDGSGSGTTNLTFYCDHNDGHTVPIESGYNAKYDAIKMTTTFDADGNKTANEAQAAGLLTVVTGGDYIIRIIPNSTFEVFSFCNYAATDTYHPKVVAERGTAPAAEARQTVTVEALPAADIKANGSDGPITIATGASATLTWCGASPAPCADAVSCTASGDWSGSKSASGGQQNATPAGASETYTLTCTGPGGSNSDSVTVNVSAETLSVALTATPPSGTAPLTTSLEALESGSAVGSRNFSFWWNCSDTTTSVSAASAACGALPSDTTPTSDGCTENANGAKCDGETESRRAIFHTYAAAVTYMAKVIVEKGSAPQAQAQRTVPVTAPALPDLTVRAGSIELLGGALIPGTNRTVRFTTDNDNVVSASAGTSTARVWVDGGFLSDTGVAALGPGSSISTTDGSWTVGSAGDHVIRVCADQPNAITESNEDNNCKEQTFTVIGPPTADIRANGFDGKTPPIAFNSSLSITWCNSPAVPCANAASCSVTKNGSAWQTGTSGTFSTGPLKKDTTYALTCTGTGGTGTDSVTVDISSSPDVKEIPPN